MLCRRHYHLHNKNRFLISFKFEIEMVMMRILFYAQDCYFTKLKLIFDYLREELSRREKCIIQKTISDDLSLSK